MNSTEVPGKVLVVEDEAEIRRFIRLSLQAESYTGAEPYPLDVLDAGTQGMIGYLIQQELRSLLPPEQQVATLLTMIVVDPDDPAATGDPISSGEGQGRGSAPHSEDSPGAGPGRCRVVGGSPRAPGRSAPTAARGLRPSCPAARDAARRATR